MTKADLIAQIATKTTLPKNMAENALNIMLETMQEVLVEEGKLTLTGFGNFIVETRKERQGRNPRSGEVITIPAAKVVKFRPGKTLKDSVN